MKLLKRLGYPEVQESTKPSTLLTKVIGSLTKRMGKVEETKKLFAVSPGQSVLIDKTLGFQSFVHGHLTSFFQSFFNFCVSSAVPFSHMRIVQKLGQVYSQLDAQIENLSNQVSTGLLEGYTPESNPQRVLARSTLSSTRSQGHGNGNNLGNSNNNPTTLQGKRPRSRQKLRPLDLCGGLVYSIQMLRTVQNSGALIDLDFWGKCQIRLLEAFHLEQRARTR